MSLKRFQQQYFSKIAWIAILAILLPVFVPLFHHPAAMPVKTPMLIAMAHCSAAIGTHNSKPADKKSSDQNSSCPICQGLNILAQGFTTPNGLAVIHGQHQIGDSPSSYQLIIAGIDRLMLAWPRAPPILA